MIRAIKQSEYYAFVEFCATPKVLRDLKTNIEFCIEYGVSEMTLSRWKRDPDFREDVKRKRQELGFDKTTDVIGAMYISIMSTANPLLIKIWLTYFGDYTEKSEERRTVEVGETLTGILKREWLEEKQSQKTEHLSDETLTT